MLKGKKKKISDQEQKKKLAIVVFRKMSENENKQKLGENSSVFILHLALDIICQHGSKRTLLSLSRKYITLN